MPRPLLFFALLLMSLCPSLIAQNGDAMGVYSDIGHPRRQEAEFDRNYSDGFPGQSPCLHWPLTPVVLSTTASAADSRVPKKARQEFDHACEAAHKKSFDDVQKHLDLALKAYPSYAEALVLLGQTQKDSGKAAEAEQSCSQARQADPGYPAAYLCLADIAARQEKWADVADLTGHVIDLHPVRAPSAFYYNSLANFHLDHLDAAEKSGLVISDQGSDNLKAQTHLLLAKIEERKGDRAAEADHLRKFLKLAPKDPSAAAVRHVLDQIKAEGDSAVSNKAPADK